ncbi:ComEC/Rec2 family competence protein [uncultured Lactobacillus sp.]|uniref:ComEC/Rec2 family competence protein n=1 Tax=uncultured Lactobacillus sp. TaxID=153152 RepID=UPI00272D74AB|nr:ComEC/Rec2 family competence protein [uncultured Lactobacillus sp.]
MKGITSIWKEEKKVNRPLLYLTGGLVLGETMALLITAEQGIFLLAAILSVFSCAHVRKRDKLPAFFVLFLLGYGCGFVRMECERAKTAKEMAAMESQDGKTLLVEGVVKEISDREDGVRLLLSECTVREGRKNPEVMSGGPKHFYVYIDEDTDLKIGMRVRVFGEGKAPESGRNPGAFDYRLYCKSRGICGIEDEGKP